ncbi:MAG: histidine kinase [Haloarculaceae archaeon]
MATETERIRRVDLDTEMHNWVIGGISGFVAGSIFGAMMSGTPYMEDVAALFGLSDPAAGWFIHLAFSIVFAWIFVALASFEQFSRYAHRPSTGAGLGVTYGVLVWFFAGSVMFPLWLTGSFRIEPNFLTLVGHIVFGAFLGAMYPIVLAHD